MLWLELLNHSKRDTVAFLCGVLSVSAGVSFQFQYGGVQRTNVKKHIFVLLPMELTVYEMHHWLTHCIILLLIHLENCIIS